MFAVRCVGTPSCVNQPCAGVGGPDSRATIYRKAVRVEGPLSYRGLCKYSKSLCMCLSFEIRVCRASRTLAPGSTAPAPRRAPPRACGVWHAYKHKQPSVQRTRRSKCTHETRNAENDAHASEDRSRTCGLSLESRDSTANRLLQKRAHAARAHAPRPLLTRSTVALAKLATLARNRFIHDL